MSNSAVCRAQRLLNGSGEYFRGLTQQTTENKGSFADEDVRGKYVKGTTAQHFVGKYLDNVKCVKGQIFGNGR
jgi:hypothetical protein